jgi:hypothetical protein
LTDRNLELPEMRLMQEVAFWRAYLRRRKEPRRFSFVDGAIRRTEPMSVEPLEPASLQESK